MLGVESRAQAGLYEYTRIRAQAVANFFHAFAGPLTSVAVIGTVYWSSFSTALRGLT
jgi:hypothetical protein